MKLNSLIGIAALLASNSVIAEPDNAHVLGEGTAPCSKWTELKADPMLYPNTYQAWARGFATAFNFVAFKNGDVMKGNDSTGMIFWIDAYCASNPSAEIAHATIEFLRTHDPDHPVPTK